jgi:tetratricopeptide (TPR) repeat protein
MIPSCINLGETPKAGIILRKFRILISFLCVCSVLFNSSSAYASAIKGIGFRKISKTANDTAEVNRHSRLVLSSVSKKVNIEYLKAHIDSAESICEKSNIELPAILHLARAEYFFQISDYNNASLEASIAMKLSESNDETVVLVRSMSFLGRYYLRTGFFKESIDYFNNTITLAEKNHLRGFVPVGYSALTNVYFAMGKTKEYNKNLLYLIEASRRENDTTLLQLGYYRLGTSLTGENRNYRNADSLQFQDYKVPDSLVFRNFKKADSLLRISLEISLKTKDTLFTILSMSGLGWNFYREKILDSAVKEYNRSLRYSIAAKAHSTSANALGNLGTIYRDMGLTELSLKYYAKAIEQAKLDNNFNSVFWVYLDMSDMYLQKKDTSNAFKNYVIYKKYSDLYLKISNTQGLADAKIRYEAETHNKELQLLSLRVRNQKLLIYGYTGLFVLSVAIGILLLSRAKINSKRRISEMNRKISDVTQANLRQQMNPHFIFNTLNSIQYYMYQHDKLATNNYLTKFSSLMRKVLENSQHTSVPLRDELDALKLYLELEMIRFKDKFDYQINVDEEIDTIMYKVPTMLIQPYVENSICHGLMPGEGKGMIKIDLKLEKEYISCTIEDNGIGREAAQEKKRRSENNHNSLGTQIITSRLELVNALYGTSLKTIYTDLKNINGEPEGTRVEIHIPILS